MTACRSSAAAVLSRPLRAATSRLRSAGVRPRPNRQRREPPPGRPPRRPAVPRAPRRLASVDKRLGRVRPSVDDRHVDAAATRRREAERRRSPRRSPSRPRTGSRDRGGSDAASARLSCRGLGFRGLDPRPRLCARLPRRRLARSASSRVPDWRPPGHRIARCAFRWPSCLAWPPGVRARTSSMPPGGARAPSARGPRASLRGPMVSRSLEICCLRPGCAPRRGADMLPRGASPRRRGRIRSSAALEPTSRARRAYLPRAGGGHVCAEASA